MHASYNKVLEQTRQAVRTAADPPRQSNGQVWADLSSQTDLDLQAASEAPVPRKSAEPPSRPPQPPKVAVEGASSGTSENGATKIQQAKEAVAASQEIAREWGDRAAIIIPLLLSDGLKWVGALLPILMAAPWLKSQVPVLYCAVIALAIVGWVSKKDGLTRNGIVGLVALVFVQEFIKSQQRNW